MTDYTATMTTLARELQAAAAFTDPDLNGDAIARRREEMRSRAIGNARSVIDGEAQSTQAAAERAAAKVPLGNGGDAAEQIARRHAWERARMLLDAGRDLDDVIESADELTAQVVAEWAPTWVRAQAVRPDRDTDPQGHHGFTEPDTAAVIPAVVARLAQVASDPAPYAVVLTTQEQAERVGVYAETVAALNSSGQLPGAVLNRLHRTDQEAYTALVQVTAR